MFWLLYADYQRKAFGGAAGANALRAHRDCQGQHNQGIFDPSLPAASVATSLSKLVDAALSEGRVELRHSLASTRKVVVRRRVGALLRKGELQWTVMTPIISLHTLELFHNTPKLHHTHDPP